MKRTKSMTNNAESAFTPKLRFPEFQGAQGWKSKNLGKLFSQREETGGTDLRLLSLTDKEGIIPQEDSNRRNNASVDRSKYLRVVPGDIAYNTMRMWEGRSALSSLEGVVSPAYTVCAPNNGTVSSFFAYYFKTPQMIEQFARYSQGLVKDTLNLKFEAFSRIAAATPAPAEQQKIAECLSTLDELMAAESQKLDALKAHKKGLMQQLFPREGEMLPSLRFSNEDDWTVAALPDVTFFQEGPGIMAVDFRSEGVPLVRLAGVGGLAVTLDGCNHLDPEKVAQKWEHFRLAANDLVISTSATFGLSSMVTDVAAGAVFYTGLIRFRPSDERLSHGYLAAFLGSPHFLRQAESAAEGGGIKHFGPTHLKRMEIPIPPVDEQDSIASCLSSLDDLISAQGDKLSTLVTHKKGLMQQLFPSLAEAEA